MQNVIDKIELTFAALDGFLGWFFGDLDGFLYALIIFVVMDYFTGILAAGVKKELSSAPSAQLNLPFIAVGKDGPHHLDIALSRPHFEMMTGDLLSRTVPPVQNALRDAGISASQLGKVLLVGGSTRMPAVERQVRELLGKEPSHSLNPDECVAMGAAVQGALLPPARRRRDWC